MSDFSLTSLNDFLGFAIREQLHETENGLLYYGTGEAAHWPVQSNLNVAAAFAVAGVVENNREKIDTALKLFRYSFRTHVTGDMQCTCGSQWGRHWISVLGLERATHAINALMPYFTDDDKARYKALRIAEADFLLDYEVCAAISGAKNQNKPESNAWNGGFLWRCALDYPEHELVPQWKEKGNSLLLNGISYITDAESLELYDGKPLKEWHIGPNFTPNYSLDHHGYMNIGYSFVTLSNIAMLHFNFKEKSQTPPKALYLHAADLWNTIKQFIFDDGRMLRIGGDSRTRYTYCQSYMIPVFFFAADVLGDSDAMRLNDNCMELIRHEQLFNGDGSFYSKRLIEVKKYSYYYYARLESDPAVVLSQNIYWKHKFNFPASVPGKLGNAVWHDDFHNAHLIKKEGVIRSFVVAAHRFSGPIALCVPGDRSDMAEWHGNLSTRFISNRAGCRTVYSNSTQSDDTFTGNCAVEWYNDLPLGEGEQKYFFASSQSAVAALGDGKTLLVIERASSIKDEMIEEIIPLNFAMPNDLFNGNKRVYEGENFKYESTPLPEKELDIDTKCRKLTVDGRVTIALINPENTLHIVKPDNRSCHVIDKKTLKSLYIDFITGASPVKFRYCRKGEVLSDTAAAVTVDAANGFASDAVYISEKDIRGVEITGADGIRYRFLANFGKDEAVWNGKTIPGYSSILEKL
ncbi:MAG: hypothetical protein IKC77_04780 [Lentisphaeria bacterium]|nr:hypothetical protein [Lentisphaeria bacterium]